MNQGVDFPEAEMPCEQQHPALLRVRMDDTLFPFELHAREHLVRPHRAELQQHDEQPAEVRKHLAGDDAALALGSHGKCGAKILDRQPAVAAIERVERASEHGAGREHRPHRQQADHPDDAGHGQVFEPVPDRWTRARWRRAWERLLVSQRCREPREVSRPAIAGTREADRAPL